MEVDEIQISIKSIVTGKNIIGDLKKALSDESRKDKKIIFEVDKDKLQINSYYKIQIAFVDNNITGYWSNIGIIKIIDEPNISLNLSISDSDNVYWSNFDYIGTFNSSDKEAKYKFTLFYDTHELETSDWQIHSRDEGVDKWTPKTVLKIVQGPPWYKIQYEVETLNGYQTKISYDIKQQSIQQGLKDQAILKTNLDNENGCIKINLIPISNKLNSGLYFLYRIDSKTNFEQITKMTEFNLEEEPANRLILKDYTIEQGITYQYVLCQAELNGAISQLDQSLMSECITPDFEHLFISDKYKQLKVIYNPKVSSLKTYIPEKKVDTIGSKYPFFFRNGNVEYKEIPISGLLSFRSDQDGHFDKKWLNIEEVRPQTPSNKNMEYNYMSNQIKNERDFKLDVLNWLNDGVPKYLRSATEGNYIVRLMNTSLSPQDTLGRMLHSFVSTAYEIGDFTQDNLEKFDLINKTYTSNLNSVKKEFIQNEIVEFNNNVIVATLINVPQDTVICLTYSNGKEKIIKTTKLEEYLYIDIDELNPLSKIKIKCSDWTDTFISLYYGEYTKDTKDIIDIPGVSLLPQKLPYAGAWLV